ncbi:MAG: CDP-alcohol phosphatidyltransferase family protein [Candidatus Nanopelagicales bacterium]|nr:CDP-alcohol phosphatidyltransferase family protein [Candidatus Nanopelagicales bacterium]
MLDTVARRAMRTPVDRLAAVVDRSAVTPNRLTLLGLVLGVSAAVSAAGAHWWLALVLWLASRVADGLDGALARRRATEAPPQAAGGFLDITADFIVYGAFVIGVGVGVGSGQSLLPFMFVLLGYYVNGSAFLAYSSIAERTGRQIDDGRSLSFLGGIAEGTETIAVHSLWCLMPGAADAIAWAWACVVLASAVARLVVGYRALA